MLAAKDVCSGYGKIEVIRSVSLVVEAKEVVSVLGINGAGKTTLTRTISRLLPCWAGQITFEGQDVTNLSSQELVRLGLAQVPEHRRIFGPMSVWENLDLGAYPKYRSLGGAGRQRLSKFVYELFPILWQRRNQAAGTLSGGEQQMLAIGRALMSEPKVLILDEPFLGLAPMVVESLCSTIKQLNAQGLTILVVEQNASVALKIAHRVYLMGLGRIEGEGKPEELRNDERIRAAYFGRDGRAPSVRRNWSKEERWTSGLPMTS